ncbi:MAG: hypothetical protein KTR35_06710 [Gammaproteobacteria bacterium]|nr:hypothetical protein [Gammaproteobacteria bacterium]
MISMTLPSFANLRITFLLIVLTVVALTSLHQRVYSRNWNQPLQVTVFPINADGHLETADYIDQLETATFSQIDRWGVREAKRHNLALTTPFSVTLGAQIHELPPAFPAQNPNELDVLFWGLRFRWWAYRHTPEDGNGLTRVRMFAMYHEGEPDVALAHSLGMQKGLMGLVHLFADAEQTQQNNIVIAHEMLHTVGAIDKYDNFGNPAYPWGYSAPNRAPLYPQRNAEIMAGRIATSSYSSYMAESLRSVVVNKHTADEINWIE